MIPVELIKSHEKMWNIFSRKEEYEPVKLDKHGNFLYRFSSYKNIMEPEVSKFLVEKGFEFFWPDEKKFAVCLTHDVDNLHPSLKNRFFSFFEHAFASDFKSATQALFKRSNFLNNFEQIIKLEGKYEGKSTFFVLTAEKDFIYHRYSADEIEGMLKFIVEEGWEIALHGGYYSHVNYENILNEKRKLEKIIGKEIFGYRNHYLRFKIPDTWNLLSKAGFKYDTTLGYNDMVGFRNGMCHPFKPYDLKNEKEIDILEIPLHIMDVTLFKHMKLSINESWRICKKLIDAVENIGGVITILWHNRTFDNLYYKGWGKIYEKILNYCHEKNAWLTCGKEIWEWCNEEFKGVSN